MKKSFITITKPVIQFSILFVTILFFSCNPEDVDYECKALDCQAHSPNTATDYFNCTCFCINGFGNSPVCDDTLSSISRGGFYAAEKKDNDINGTYETDLYDTQLTKIVQNSDESLNILFYLNNSTLNSPVIVFENLEYDDHLTTEQIVNQITTRDGKTYALYGNVEINPIFPRYKIEIWATDVETEVSCYLLITKEGE